MLESFFVYTSLLVILPFLGHTAKQYYFSSGSNRLYRYWGFLFCIIILFSLIFGARYNVGIDYPNYKLIYETIRDGKITDDIIEPGFYWICKVLGSLDLHSFFFFGFFCCLQISFIILAFKNKPNLIPWILLILLSTQFMIMMNLVRQMTFVCCFIWMVSRINSMSFIRYAIIVAICTFLFHKSAVLVLPLYPFIKAKKNLCFTYLFQNVFFLICVYLGYSHFILDKFEDFSTIASFLGYSQYEGFNVLEALFMDPNWGPRTLIRVALVFVTILFSKEVKAKFQEVTFTQFYNIFFWGVCAEIVLYGTNVIARVFLPMYYMKLIIYAYTLYHLVTNYRKSYRNLFMCCCYVMLLVMDYGSIFYEAKLPGNSSAFRFFWQV